MINLTKKETNFKARILQLTSQDKYKLSIYSEALKKELGLFFINKDKIDITEEDINKVIHFKGKMRENQGKYYLQTITDIRRNQITYSREERRTKLAKYMNGEFFNFSGVYNYTRENDNRSLFTEIIFKNKRTVFTLDHLNIGIKKELEKGKRYTFKAKITRYEKEHASGYFYSVEKVKAIKEVRNKEKTENKKPKVLKKEEEMILIPKKEYDNLIELKKTIKKLQRLILS